MHDPQLTKITTDPDSPCFPLSKKANPLIQSATFSHQQILSQFGLSKMSYTHLSHQFINRTIYHIRWTWGQKGASIELSSISPPAHSELASEAGECSKITMNLYVIELCSCCKTHINKPQNTTDDAKFYDHLNVYHVVQQWNRAGWKVIHLV